MPTPFDGIETSTGDDPQFAIIWLHGLGADGGDFAPIVPQLVHRDWPAIRFVFPHAPVRPVTINNGMSMRAWYDIRGMSIDQRQDEAGVRESVALVNTLIEREVERGIARERIFIAGFSQGGAIALAAGVRHSQTLAGVIALSTYLPLAEQTASEARSANRSLPIFMAHGSQDPVVAQSLGERSAAHLRQLGYQVDWHSYPMPHSVSLEEITDLAHWLGSRLMPAS